MKTCLVSLFLSSVLLSCGGKVEQSKESSKENMTIESVVGEHAALLQKLHIPFTEMVKGLGPHRYESTLSVKTSVRGKEQLSFTQKTVWEVESAAVRHLLVENSSGNGYELFQKDSSIVMRNRYEEAFVARDYANADQLFQDSWETLYTYLSLFSNLSVKKQESKLWLGKSGEVAPFSPIDTAKNWRETARLVEASGEIQLDPKTTLPLAATVSLQFQARENGKIIDFAVTYSHKFEDIGSKELVVKFPETAIEPEPRRPSFERTQLLGLPPTPTSAPTKETKTK